MGWPQYSVILINIKMQINVTSCKFYQPKSVVPWGPEDAVMSLKVMCEQGSTLEQTVT
jgi:hypothetical protein